MKCNNCVHKNLCFILNNDKQLQDCQCFKDQNKFIELPCKVGDMVYDISFGEINEYKIIAFDLYSKMGIAIYEIDYEDRFGFDFHQFGKTIFLTKETAEQALKEREEK